MPLQPNSMLGPYQIVGILGEGGMGVVYRAKDTRLGRDVAIKIMTGVATGDRERLARFEQEARATGMLNHPNLLTIFDVGSSQGTPYLVSELLEGETLRARLERAPLAPRKAVEAAYQMAQGLAAAHEKGVVHRDLKPDNVFLTRDGRVKILDFGIAKLSARAGDDGPTFAMAATEPGMVLGTVGYMSPEQVRGEVVDHRSDIFAFGAIVFEMLTGTRAFKRNSSIETLSAILKEDPPDLTELLPSTPPALERLVRRCLEKDREVRFQSARDLAFNLETLTSMSSSSTLSNVARPATPTASRPAAPASDPPTVRHPATPAPAAAPRTQATSARPRTQALTKPKRRVSPLLLALFYLASVAGAAWGTWFWATRKRADAQEMTFDRVTFRRGEVRGARFTPDGETIVYSAAWDGRPPEIFTATRSATDARPLGLSDAEVLAVSKTEVAVLLRRDRLTGLGTLARVPLAGGMPRELADGVLGADWSPDGAQLAAIRLSGDKYRVEYPLGTTRYETLHHIRDVRVSPDGARLAFFEPVRGDNQIVVLADGAPEPIAHGWARGANGLAWRPDGKELWITGTATSAPPALWAVTLDGDARLVSRLTGSMKLFDISRRGAVLLTNGTWRATILWSPDPPVVGDRLSVVGAPAQPVVGDRLSVVGSEPAGAGGPTTDNRQPTTASMPTTEREVSWLDWSILADLSPDGKTILFNETREGGGAKSAVYLRRSDAPVPVRIGDGFGDALSPDGKWALTHAGAKLVLLPTGSGMARELKVDGAFDPGAVWLPDSRRAILGGVTGKSGYQLHVVDTLDETAKAITPEGIWNGGTRPFAVSPDGLRVAGMSAERKIVLYTIDGAQPPVTVTGVEPGEIPVLWSADGGLLVYRPTELPANVVRVDLATGARTPWKTFTPADPAGVYRIAPVLVTPDGRGYAYNALRNLNDLYVGEGLR